MGFGCGGGGSKPTNITRLDLAGSFSTTSSAFKGNQQEDEEERGPARG